MVAHESMGQQVLYRELKDNPKSKDLTLEAHHIVELLSLEELEKTPVTDEQWEPKFTVAWENIKHYIEQEKTSRCSRCAANVFSSEELDQVGARMAEIQTAAEQVLAEDAPAAATS